MKIIYARNVNDAWVQAYSLLLAEGIPSPSREGDVLALPYPLVTHYVRSQECVLFDPVRDGNPFFHFFEALWMIAGRNDLKFLLQFNKRIAQYSDNGHTLTGSAYGWAWRKRFGSFKKAVSGIGEYEEFEPLDQLEAVIQLLKKSPDTRRAVLQMWSPDDLINQKSKSLPCNTAVYFRNQGHRLQMTVTCRSNDAIWGAYGSNVVHFSMLQEYVAGRLGLDVGSYYQVSNNFHVYVNNPYWQKLVAGAAPPSHTTDFYETGAVSPYGMFTMTGEAPEAKLPAWDRDLKLFFEDPSAVGFEFPFFHRVVKPLWFSHLAYKRGEIAQALEISNQCAAQDWRLAAQAWLERRRTA